MFCPQCGAPNEDDGIFCGNCGAVLDPDNVTIESEALEETPGAEVMEEVEEVIQEAAPEEESVQDELLFEPPPPPPGPPTPPRPPVPPSAPPTSGMAIASLIMGIVGLTLLPLIGSILALIFGYMARNDIRQRPDEVSGEGLAIAGIVMGWIMIGLSVLMLLGFGGLMVCGVCSSFGAGGY
jgi:hypothetical protein